MKRRTPARALIAALAAASLVAVAACSSDPAPEGETTTTPEDTVESFDPDAPVTITVSDYPSSEEPELRADFEARVEAFMEVYDNITVEPEETVYAPDTFQAMLAGGTMPTTLRIPYTDIAALIERQQVADVSDFLGDFEVLSELNPSLMESVSDDAGNVWGVPVSAYSMALIYNRALFDEAGLDPEAPPSTWEEVREAAQLIDEQTDAQGYSTMTTDTAGGWILSATSVGFGGTFQNADGSAATVADGEVKDALEFLQALRWEDDVMGSNFLIDWGTAYQEFAAGQVGMMVAGSDSFGTLNKNFGMDADAVGIAPLPQAEGGLGTQGGGTIVVISPDADPAQVHAGLRWIEYNEFAKFSDEEVARTQAQATFDGGWVVGAPEIRMVNEEVYATWLGWVDEFINVPRENFSVFIDSVEDFPLVSEPATSGQDTYALMSPVVQAVLTDEGADIDALLTDAQTAIQGLIDAAG